ncbi:MetQ/NlpA family ABC transporter substrate-binding protein [Pseudorhodoferax sp. Leaf265]|uniref:MetQ/NlpA family ABC transporter substrate-binding protein n=1 Tax=Pseudorhodoferax sp. Leaf265 TaxID=1736315 RepID=UPI000700E850|nr:MetQ/NlpA family ABC transporter substrate-binding protein [Pseudorhodoferax sp. Leaf265]KQP19508.1 methionine-binding protein [Pseudorhodoferax sp. Leaf265]PZP95285.1 MAG: methionine-binding protein [Variovorax paradoxus]PZQ06018.1 MAG: methionine-binding protein [Variovorax paradoxus]
MHPLSHGAARRSLVLAALAAAVLASTAAAATELSVGFMPGPYRDAFAKGIAPQLEKQGYTIKYVEFSQGVQPNDAVERGQIQANIFQHSLYLEATNKRQGFDLVPVVHVPTPPMGLYSQKHKTLAAVPDGATVTLPADPVNAARALNILAAIGWVQVKPGVDPISVSERDIVANPKKLKLVPLDAAQAPRSLADADLAAVQGNFAVASGLKLTEALKLEDMTLPYVNVVAVKRGNANARFAQDIVAAYRAPEFQKVFQANPVWAGYRLPDYFKKD